MVKKVYGTQSGDSMEDLNVNLAVLRLFMNTTLRAAVHVGKDYDMNLRFVKIDLWKNNGTAFQRSRKADQWSDCGRTRLGQVAKLLGATAELRLTRACGSGKAADKNVGKVVSK